jgi:glucoamylase
VGSALSGASLLWYTVADGIVTEVYYPDVDTPQIRDLQLLITDGSTFFHDGTRNDTYICEPIDPDALGLRLTKTAVGQPYSLTQDIIAEPGSSVLLVRTKIDCTPAFLQNLHVYVLVSPHLEGRGAGNNGYVARTAKGVRLVAHRGDTWMAMNADCGFRSAGCGFVGVNDGWQDIIQNRRLQQWTFDSALNGNVALTGEIDLNGRSEFVLALAFGQGDENTPNSALVALAEALSYPFEAPAGQYSHLATFLSQWKSTAASRFVPKSNATFDQARLFNYSRNVLLAHEDKTFSGALVASLSIPWGQIQGDLNGGYHLVWPRDMSQSATALLAAGELDMPLRGLIYLSASQSPDGSFHQKFMIDGQVPPDVYDAQQLDEYSFPIMLAYRLSAAGALQQFDPRPMVLAAAGALIAHGPMTEQERWEENQGYSPSTLAANIAALVCAAHFAALDPQDQPTAQFLLEYADFLESHVEAWTVTTQGTLLSGVTRHFIRLLPTSVKGGGGDPTAPEDPNTATISIGNRGGLLLPAKEVVDGGFLELVRYGIRAGGDPLFEDSLKVLDYSIKKVLPQGPCWHRYSDDGYGQQDNGGPFTGVGVGRPWPLLAGERAHYELAAGRDVSSYLQAMEGFAGTRGLLAEQLWDAAGVPSSPPMILGQPTGSAMPLAWAHAEYIRLVRSASDGKVFDRIDLVANRYLQPHAPSDLEVWNFDRQILAMPRGSRLRIPLANNFNLRWSSDAWNTAQSTAATATAAGIFYADISTDAATRGPLVFTFFWIAAGTWEGRNYQVNLT